MKDLLLTESLSIFFDKGKIIILISKILVKIKRFIGEREIFQKSF